MATEIHLTTVEASNLAGVGPSTVKRWADQGLLPCARTAGGHRRFERSSLERFLREQVEVPGRREAALTSWVELLMGGRGHEVDALLLEARARLGAWYRVADELGSLLTKLGEQWTDGLLAIAEEHLVSDGLTRALGRVGQAMPNRAQPPRCVLACAEGDEHTLGLSLAELCLVELGWTPLWIGARTPTVETIRLAEKSGARMVAMSASAASSDAALLGRIASLALALVGCATTTTARLRLPELQTVPHVDLGRYVGIWYEIASFPQSFQRGCTATTATYTLRDDGQIDVVNRCRKGSPDGPEKVARGRARVVDRSSNARLEVSFFRPFWGDYWIIDLGADYEYAVVGHPGRDYLWILSRTPTMKADVYNAILQRLAAQGYETNRLVRTVHGPSPEQSSAEAR